MEKELEIISNSVKLKPYFEASKIAILYGIMGVLWIAFPDTILKKFLNNYDFDIDLCEQVNVKYQSGVIFANVNNAQIEINKKYVVINKNLCYQRKTKYNYDNNDDTIISIRK